MDTLILAVLLPLMGFFINGFLHLFVFKDHTKAVYSGAIATLVMLASFLSICYSISLGLTGFPFHGVIEVAGLEWLRFKNINIQFGLRLDGLSAVFALVITGVGSLIHLYSLGYMSHDRTPARYFAYLNLFCFMMLVLVLGSSLPMVFLGWEGVGLCSYLLIGYWHEDYSKVAAGQKAFVMNRIGDFAFLFAMFFAATYVQTLDLIQLTQATWDPSVLMIFGFLIFFACTGKSAQLPLFTWLPDAMAGPTPVSALIHAATMVTSGVYLLARLSPVITQNLVLLNTIAIVGGVTAVIAATTACAQTDIKKVLAYSTVSQLGLMFLAIGAGATEAAVFHVVTHAFFKALLFLGAGSVIHSLSNEQNIFKMGALRKKLPITFATFFVAWAAILGLPPTSGFFSKDALIVQSLVGRNGSITFFTLGIATTVLTAFYMTRLLFIVFFGTSKVSSEAKKNLHESPSVMTLPLVLLALLSFAGGFLGKPVQLSIEDLTSHSTLAVVLALLAAVLGAGISLKKYSKNNSSEEINTFLFDAWKIDNFYQGVFVRGLKSTASMFSKFEKIVIDGFIKACVVLAEFLGSLFKSFQTGSIQSYLFIGMLFVIVLFWAIMMGVHTNGI